MGRVKPDPLWTVKYCPDILRDMPVLRTAPEMGSSGRVRVVSGHGLTIALRRDSGVPLYQQVARHIELQISGGELRPGARLANEISLAESLGLSRPTMRRAIQQLVDKGLLVRKRGVGTQVVHGRITRPIELTSLHDDLARGHVEPTTEVLTYEIVPADEDVASALGVPPGSAVLHTRRLRSASGEPLAVMDNHLPADLAPPARDLGDRGLYQLLRERGIRMRVARQRISARSGTPEECRLLAERRNAPLLAMERSTHDDSGRVVEWGRHVYRSSLYSFEMTLVER